MDGEKYKMEADIINITPYALSMLKKFSASEDATPLIRVGIRGGGCSGFMYFLNPLQMQEKEDDDIIITVDEELSLVVDSISLPYLEGITLDYVETLTESGFKFNNSKFSKTCGCGKSFG